MKIGLFINDEVFIQEQLLLFFELAPRLALDSNNFHVFVKPPRSHNRLVQPFAVRKIINKYFAEKVVIYIRRRFKKLMISSRWNDISSRSTFHKIDSINSVSTQEILARIDIGVFINFDEIVKEKSLSIIKQSFNIHNGLLPEYRGCQPIVWQMLAKERLSAMTFHVMTKGIDDGDVVFECPFEINLNKGIQYNNIQSFRAIPQALYFGLRRVLLCKAPYINQSDYLIKSGYYRRPGIEDLSKINS